MTKKPSVLHPAMRPNKLGSTEYGLKAIPLGGFCDIAGMTAAEDLRPEDEPHAIQTRLRSP